MMTNNIILLVGVAYQGIDNYIKQYCKSIESQKAKFDILIICDNYNKTFPLKNENIYFENVDNLSPAQIRAFMIEYAVKNKYKYLVFSDLDDYYSNNRIQLSVEKMQDFDFIFNELDIVNDKGVIIKNNYLSSLYIKEKCEDYKYILDKNFFGLSNSSVKVDKIKGICIPDGIIAVDWWIFTLLLLNGCKGRFVKDAKTYYRQSANNLVGVGKQLNEKRFQMGINVKIIHYKNVKIYCDNNKLEKEKAIYNNKLEEMLELSEEVKNPVFRKRYIEIINKNYKEIFKGWWSEILPISEWRKFAK